MKHPKAQFKGTKAICTLLLVCIMFLSCGLTALAAEEGSPDLPQISPPIVTEAPPTDTTESPPPEAVILPPETLYPADVQTIILDGSRQIVKTYILTAGQSPDAIPCEDFERDEWLFTLTDITERRTSTTDAHSHVEKVEINTESNDLNEIIMLLAPTLDYQGDDGYCGLLSLDLSSVSCEVAGYKNSGYTVSATREYPHLSANDLSLIPKSITENGRMLELDDVAWEVQHSVNVDYEEIPDSYRAVAQYTANASRSVVTGYITTAEYSGEISKGVSGNTTYTVYFTGKAINPDPVLPELPFIPTTDSSATKGSGGLPFALLISFLAFVAAIAGASIFLFKHHNVKIYNIQDEGRVLVAKDKISNKKLSVDLTPLDNQVSNLQFMLEIDRLTAKSLNGRTVEVVFGSAKLAHKIAYEGSLYKIDANFHNTSIKAIY